MRVMGPDAETIVQPFLQSKRPIDLERMGPDELRLVRWCVAGEVVDDALVCVRRTAAGEAVVDVSVHGGPRIVQRVLMALRDAGARVVPAGELMHDGDPGATPFEREVMEALLGAKTRAAVGWLVRLLKMTPAMVEDVGAMIDRGEVEAARSRLEAVCAGMERAGYLLNGVRCVLTGEPNAGKSTLANALAEREQAVVSETAGTTRDWVEHPGAVAGVPFTLVDTAGLRDTGDALEQEAIRRSRAEIGRADVVVHVLDGSRGPTEAERQAVETAGGGPAKRVFVWNKTDLPLDGAQRALMERAKPGAMRVSGRTGEGVERLRAALLEAVGLSNWEGCVPLIFRERHVRACRAALSALDGSEKGGRAAQAALAGLMCGTSR